MSIALDGPHYVDKLKDFVQSDDEILEGYYIAGEFDYMIKIITEDTESLKDILDRIKGIKGVGKTKTIVALSNIKNKHSILPK
jgi:Lrp/AsnC family leucine-responsive transcriptional regulator